LDTEDLHCLRKARQKAVKENRIFVESDLLVEETAIREIASILRCDLTWIISSYEMQLLQNVFKIDKRIIEYLPMWVDSTVQHRPTFDQKIHFAFIGNFLHDPNWDAVLYLKKDIWPRIRKQIPHAELHIFGAYPSQKVWDLHNEKEGFVVKGRVDSIAHAFDTTRVFLAPLRFGAGVKGKLIESMVHGVPNVTTPVGAESMHANYPWNGYVEENPDTFSARAVTLYTNQQEWEISVENGGEILRNIYQKNTTFIQKLETIYSELTIHRTTNFLGNLLQHQTLQATKYMSKWIALKNLKE
jgi:glycosyltransferase involved in cell wall biosynthesis